MDPELQKLEKKRKELAYEQSLIYPGSVADARNILKEGRGVFKDALIIFEGQGSKEDIDLLKGFIIRMKKNPELYRAANRKTINGQSFEPECLRIIKVLQSPNLKQHQYEFGLYHVTTIERARNVYKEGKGDFIVPNRLLECSFLDPNPYYSSHWEKWRPF